MNGRSEKLSPMKLLRTHHVAVICSDYERSKAFYTEILGLEVVREVERKDAARTSSTCGCRPAHPGGIVLLPGPAEASELPRGLRSAPPRIRGC